MKQQRATNVEPMFAITTITSTERMRGDDADDGGTECALIGVPFLSSLPRSGQALAAQVRVGSDGPADDDAVMDAISLIIAMTMNKYDAHRTCLRRRGG